MSTRKLDRSAVLRLVLSRRRRARRRTESGQADLAGRDRGLGHQHPAGRHRACRRAAARRAGRARSMREVRCCATARTGKGGISAALVGGAPINGIDAAKTIANFWPYATTLFDFIRRAMPWHATALAHQRRGLRADRLHSGAEQADRRERRDERADASQGADAEPRRLHPALSRENVVEQGVECRILPCSE